MPTSYIRYKSNGGSRWARLLDEPPSHPDDMITVAPLIHNHESTAALIASDRQESHDILRLAGRELVAPLAGDPQIICQGLNYHAHSAESGHSHRGENLFFTKATSAISGPFDEILCPPDVQLLDYEVEIALIVRQNVQSAITVTDKEVGKYVAGVVLCNDISARDIMFGASFFQWFQGKSYRGFCPSGPVLWLFEPEEAQEFLNDLSITLDWNGDRRQSARSSSLIYRPAETLTQLSAFVDLRAGDLLLTGTPGGVIARATPEVVEILSTKLVVDAERRDALRSALLRHSKFMEPGDIVETHMELVSRNKSLGGQRNRIAR